MQNKNSILDADVRNYCHFFRFTVVAANKNRWKRDE